MTAARRRIELQALAITRLQASAATHARQAAQAISDGCHKTARYHQEAAANDSLDARIEHADLRLNLAWENI